MTEVRIYRLYTGHETKRLLAEKKAGNPWAEAALQGQTTLDAAIRNGTQPPCSICGAIPLPGQVQGLVVVKNNLNQLRAGVLCHVCAAKDDADLKATVTARRASFAKHQN
jgi:hypothetical protein